PSSAASRRQGAWLRPSPSRALHFDALVRQSLAIERLTETGLLDPALDARTLLLQAHGNARVALAPATVERLRQLGEGEVRHAHRHAVLASELRRQRDVLVGQAQGEVRRVVLAAEELVRDPVEGALAAARALAHGLPERQRLDAGLHAQSEDLSQRGLDGVAGAVVDELGDGARSDGTDVDGFVADGVRHGRYWGNTDSSPPTQSASLRVRAPLGPPLTGASSRWTPFLAKTSCTRRTTVGELVVRSK